MEIKGVKRVIRLPYGVAIIGDTFEATKKGREALEVKWSTALGNSFSSEKAMGEYLKIAADPAREAVVWKSKGDKAAGLKGAATVKSFEYTSEHNYHAQMEPMNATARVSADGKSAEIWASTQGTTIAQLVLAKVLKTSPANVTVYPQMIGGGFGRRAQPDFVVDSVLLSKIIGGGTPVKVF
jgi:isoquinoline 1-oxidoreductase beta subunit